MKISFATYSAFTILLILTLGVWLAKRSAQVEALVGNSIDTVENGNAGGSTNLKKIRDLPNKSAQVVNLSEKAYYEIVNGKSPLSLNQDVIKKRIKEGLLRMNAIGYKILRDGEVTTIKSAYHRLINGAVFMDGNYPLWGIEDEEYFVFSGRNGRENELAFKSGYAVKKSDGSIYRWFDLEYQPKSLSEK